MSNTQTPSLDGFRRSSRSLQPPESGELLRFTRQDVGWEWMSFLVRRLVPGQVWETRNAEEETVVLMLGGTSLADWGEGRQQIGQRKNVLRRRSEEHTSELQSHLNLVCRLLLEKKKQIIRSHTSR